MTEPSVPSARILGLVLKLYPSNKQRMLNKDLCAVQWLRSYIVLDLSSAVTNLPNKTSIFHDFQGPTIKCHDFQA